MTRNVSKNTNCQMHIIIHNSAFGRRTDNGDDSGSTKSVRRQASFIFVCWDETQAGCIPRLDLTTSGQIPQQADELVRPPVTDTCPTIAARCSPSSLITFFTQPLIDECRRDKAGIRLRHTSCYDEWVARQQHSNYTRNFTRAQFLDNRTPCLIYNNGKRLSAHIVSRSSQRTKTNGPFGVGDAHGESHGAFMCADSFLWLCRYINCVLCYFRT